MDTWQNKQRKLVRQLLVASMILALMLFPAACRWHPATKTAAQILDENKDAIVLVSHEKALGTGFLYKKYVITNFHVIAGARHVTVKVGDRVFGVDSVVAYDPYQDIAVLQSSGTIASVTLGNSSLVKSGDEVVVIGNPLGLEKTVSNGLISAIREKAGQKVFQMSAPISPGSSGGPVFDTTGHVIGVAFASMVQGQNLNFARPIDYVKQLIATGTPTALTASAGAVMVFVTKEGRKYHREDCGYLNQGRIVITLQQAIQSGYTPCSVCNPPSSSK